MMPMEAKALDFSLPDIKIPNVKVPDVDVGGLFKQVQEGVLSVWLIAILR